MKRVLIIAALAVAAPALGDWTYEGQWGTPGTGDGQFYATEDVAVAPNGNVYVADTRGQGRRRWGEMRGRERSRGGTWASPS